MLCANYVKAQKELMGQIAHHCRYMHYGLFELLVKMLYSDGTLKY